MMIDADNKFVRFLAPAGQPETVCSATLWWEPAEGPETMTGNIG